MRRPAALLAVVLAIVASSAGRAETSTVADAIVRLSGYEATFTQRFLPRGYKKEQVESGRVVFGAAPASRWTYEAPEPKTFVFDGTTSWMFVPADATVMIHKVTAEEKNRLPFFVLADPGRLDEWYRVETPGKGRTKLTATNDEALLRSIEVELDDQARPRVLEYTDSQGNRTRFELANWKKAPTAPDTFTFTPPPGVDVIEN
jgi:outer membrane lipoprotein carrier protein